MKWPARIQNYSNSITKKLKTILIAVTLLAFFPFFSPQEAESAPIIFFEAFLDGDQEVPPVTTSVTGFADVVLDGATNELSWEVSFDTPSSALTGAHFHGPADFGVNAGIQVDIGALSEEGLATFMSGSTIITEAQKTDLIDELWYINIHTTANPDGEIRGQVLEEFDDHPCQSCGDFNGDGFIDVAIGVPNEDIGATTDAGVIQVLYGTSASGLQTTSPADQTFFQGLSGLDGALEAEDFFGIVLIAGDFNGDFFDDLAIGVPAEDIGAITDAGLVQVLYGTAASGLQTTSPADQTFFQGLSGLDGSLEASDFFGAFLEVGDFNGDDIDDLAIGVPDEDIGATTDAGVIQVLYGTSASGLQTTSPADQTFFQGLSGLAGSPEADDLFGEILEVGDFNGDGIDDLAIGVPNEDIGATADAGLLQVLYGTSASGLQTTSPLDQVFIQGGGGDSDPGVDGFPEASDRFGEILDVGDFNGDFIDDVIIGVPDEDIGATTDAGLLQVLYGTSASGLQTTSPADQTFFQGLSGLDGAAEASDFFGDILQVGDFNDDFIDDVIIGVEHEDIGATADAGVIQVLYGTSASGLQTTSPADQTFFQGLSGLDGALEASDFFGGILQVGDFNDDFIDDVIIGVPDEDIGATTDAGLLQVLYGTSASGLQTTSPADQTFFQGLSGLDGALEASDFFGGILKVGDFNGDGIDDVIIGVPDEDIGATTDAGLLQVLYGTSASGLQTTSPADQTFFQGLSGLGGAIEASDFFGDFGFSLFEPLPP